MLMSEIKDHDHDDVVYGDEKMVMNEGMGEERKYDKSDE